MLCLRICYLIACMVIPFGSASLSVSSAGSKIYVTDTSLMQFMTRSRNLSRQNPQRALACFDYYLPILNNISVQYEKDYFACVDKAAKSRCIVDSNTQQGRERLAQNAQDACELYGACNKFNNVESFFTCYADVGAENAKLMYVIARNATDWLDYVHVQYSAIEYEENRCTNYSERVYVEQTTETYELLHDCLVGKRPIPATEDWISALNTAESENMEVEKAPLQAERSKTIIGSVKEKDKAKYHFTQRDNKAMEAAEASQL